MDIVFRNNLNSSVNIIPSGAVTNSTEAADPGETVTYQWTIGTQVCSSHARRQRNLWVPLHVCLHAGKVWSLGHTAYAGQTRVCQTLAE